MAPRESLTEAQFSALAQLLRLRQGPATEAARRVLVEGRRPAEVARALGLSPQAVCNAVSRCRRGLILIEQITP
jgi:DNA-directed RNA polymerase specialized sigma24 family protein